MQKLFFLCCVCLKGGREEQMYLAERKRERVEF